MDEDTVAAYLDRVAVTPPVVADAAALRVLHRAHQVAVPFENLSIHIPEPISLDEADLVDKIVRRRRGGFCYELNGGFALLLQALGRRGHPDGGAGVRRRPARAAVRPPGPGRPAAGRDRALAGRRGLRRVTATSRCCWTAGPSRTIRPAGSSSLTPRHGDVDVLKDGEPQYRIELRERSLADFLPTCWWQQTSPSSHFTQHHHLLAAHRRGPGLDQRPDPDPDHWYLTHRGGTGQRRRPAGRLPRPLRRSPWASPPGGRLSPASIRGPLQVQDDVSAGPGAADEHLAVGGGFQRRWWLSRPSSPTSGDEAIDLRLGTRLGEADAVAEGVA